ADVSHYVEVGSALDAEASERGTSVYFPTRVIPMLPEGLSNGLCSLNPKVDRLCMVCEMHVGPQGKVSQGRFFEGLMRSHARLTYNEAATLLWGSDKRLAKRFAHVLDPLRKLDDVYRALAKARRRRGAIDFDMPSVRFNFDDRGRVAGVEKYERNDAHKIIEECMIAANVQAALFLKRHRMPTLYRRHVGPDEEALDKLRTFLGPLGLRLPAGFPVKPKAYREVLRQIAGRPDALMIETVLLRSMSQAEYHPQNLGHFGLALPAYAHFTSPIRRYPDLLVHRGIRHVLRGGMAFDFHYRSGVLAALGASCSAAERRADEATRDAMDWLKCEFMQDKIGDTFDGVVTGVTHFGLFVLLTDCQVEGLVHVSSLGHDYYRHDRERHRLVGERTGRVYRLTDPMTVRVIRASLEDRKIDFEPVASARPGRGDGHGQGNGQGNGKPKGSGKRRGRGKKRRRR
ncbi:MAG: VacB/RNase II family 3'-5' exoribonuclease, partial [Pseudomonadota bacterium]